MLTNPFLLLAQFPHLHVSLFTKADDITTDTQVREKIDVKESAALNQVHGKRTIVVRTQSDRTEEADGMLTDVPGLALCIRAADCQNFVLYAPVKNVVGVLHVGWRGLVAGAISEFLRVLKDEWGIDPKDTFVGAGPSLCVQCADFSDPARELPTIDQKFIHGKTVDLRAAATAEFLELGVSPEHIERSEDCTRCHPEKYFTYRGGDRDAVKAGHTNVLACVLNGR